jgi:CubicO group peptidase (beta-lactamase class C family)
MRHLLFSLLLFVTYLLTAQSAAGIQIEIDKQKLSLTEAMKATNSPGFSYYLDRGEQREGVQLGLTEAGSEQRINEHTTFQVGSPSSALLAFATLQLATEGMIDLDKPVNQYLKRWKIPGRKASSLTVRGLLLSKGKFGTTYKPEGYLPQDKLPSLLEVINGNGPAKNQAFTFRGIRKPNTNLEYGGWLVL